MICSVIRLISIVVPSLGAKFFFAIEVHFHAFDGHALGQAFVFDIPFVPRLSQQVDHDRRNLQLGTAQREIENGARTIVGVNDFVAENEEIDIPLLEIKKEVEEKQVRRLKKLKETRDNEMVSKALSQLNDAAVNGKNLMPELVNCAKAYATLGEMINILKNNFGEYTEPAEF